VSFLSLPDINDPLILPDGSILHTDGTLSRPKRSAAATSIEIPSNTEAKAIVSATRRTLSDLPLTPASTNPIAVILSYVLFGLSNTDISIATSIPEPQIIAIRSSTPFLELYETLKTTIIEQESENVRGFFVAASRAAATRVAELITDTDNPLVALKASQDILDRAGHRPADVLLIKGQMENVLKIEHYRKDGSKIDNTAPTIDLKVNP